jgi:ATP-dependent 26S proteasome regulatory subunit
MFIMTTNHLNDLDPALIRDGRIDVTIELKCCDHYQIRCMYEKIMKNQIDENILKRIAEYKHKPVTIINHLIRHCVVDSKNDDIMSLFYEKI